MLERIVGLFLLATPFLIAFGLFSFLNPTGFWEYFAVMILALLICVPEGILAWVVGLALLLY